MTNYATVQDQFCSSYDKRKLCGFDYEFVDRPTRPLLHQTSRFLFFLKGEGKILIDGNSYDIVPNTWLAILPWDTTEITEVNKPMQFIKCVYNSDFISQSMKSSYNTGNEMFSILTPIGNYPVIYCTKEETETVLQVFDVIKNEVGVDSIFDATEEKELSNIYVTNKLCELLILFKRYITKKECVQQDGHSIELTKRNEIFKYMYSHLNEKQTLAKLSGVFFMSESAISKYIYNVTNYTFNDMLNEMRITKATDLLVNTDLNQEEIAQLVGYNDSSHFSKTFKEQANVTPKEYRDIYASITGKFSEKEKSLSYEIINYIYNNFSQDITIQQIAHKFNSSVVEINRILLFQVEKNFEDFLTFLRINKSCILLLTTDSQIIDIACAVGYNNLKTFSRNFIKIKNMTPKAFRNKILFQKGSETILVENLH